MGMARFIYVDYRGAYKDVTLREWLRNYNFSDNDEGQAFLRCPDSVRHAMLMQRVWRRLVTHDVPELRALGQARCTMDMDMFYRVPPVGVTSPFSATTPFDDYNWLQDRPRSIIVDRLLNLTHRNTNDFTSKNDPAFGPCGRDGYSFPSDYPMPSLGYGKFTGALVGKMRESQYEKAVTEGQMVRASAARRSDVGRILSALLQPYGVEECRLPVEKVSMLVERPRSQVTRTMMPLRQLQIWDTIVALLPRVIHNVMSYQSSYMRDQVNVYKEEREHYGMWLVANRQPIVERLAEWDWAGTQGYYRLDIDQHVHAPRSVPHGQDFRITVPGIRNTAHVLSTTAGV